MRSHEANRLTYEEFRHIFDQVDLVSYLFFFFSDPRVQVTEAGRPVGLHLKGANQTLSCMDLQNDSLQSFCVPKKPRREGRLSVVLVVRSDLTKLQYCSGTDR